MAAALLLLLVGALLPPAAAQQQAASTDAAGLLAFCDVDPQTPMCASSGSYLDTEAELKPTTCFMNGRAEAIVVTDCSKV